MRLPLALAFACLAMAACGDDESSPPNTDVTVPPGYEKVTGSEKLGWDQQAANSQELATFRYLVYVDSGQGVLVQNVMCSNSAGASGFSCTGAMPPLTAGEHTLRLSSFIEIDGGRYESGSSPPLNVFFVASSSRATTASRVVSFNKPDSALPAPFSTTTADGLQIQVRAMADGLIEPTDMAPVDGAIWIAERTGFVRVYRGGRLLPAPALTLTDVAVADGQGLLGIAADPSFNANRFVYLVYTADSGFRVARFRAVGDTLGERAVLIDGIPFSQSRPAASLRFGPDGRLYLGLDDAGDFAQAGDFGSLSGKILRLNVDGTTPSDQASASPVFAANVAAPRAIDWERRSDTLWVADETLDGRGQLQVVAVQKMSATSGRRGSALLRYSLPDGAAPRGMLFYRGDLLAGLRGNLLVATEAANGDAAILRVVLDDADPRKVSRTERLLRGSIDSARAIATAADGVIYLCTRDTLLALAP